MRAVPAVHRPRGSLKRRLFGYMLVLAVLLALAILLGLIALGRFVSDEKTAYESLDVQMEFFYKDVFRHFDRLAAASIQLSKDATLLLENRLAQWGLPFDGLNGRSDLIRSIQQALIGSLHQKLLQENCSGVFVMLNTTIGRSLPDDGCTQTGLYLQRSGYDNTDESALLYRGLADVGKAHDVMPHRKWRLEFRTDLFPDYDAVTARAVPPVESAYMLTELFTLPGTSEKAMLVTAPLLGSDGRFYGVCGYEVSASYFVSFHAQPTKIPHLTCLMTPAGGEILDAGAGLSCGGGNGYYRAPRGELAAEPMGGGLTRFVGEGISYVGLTRDMALSKNDPAMSLAVMMLQSDYDGAARKSALQSAILLALLLFFAVSCCLYFSRRFLSPVLQALEQIRAHERSAALSHVPEIDDLFVFLAERDSRHKNAVRALEAERLAAQLEKERLQSEFEAAQKKYQSAQREIARLAYARKREVDPDDYERFLTGIDSLTAAERRIFGCYLEGKTVREIMEIAGIKESTLRYHNQNIYGKLGVNSLKQLLRYAALMRQGEKQLPSADD